MRRARERAVSDEQEMTYEQRFAEAQAITTYDDYGDGVPYARIRFGDETSFHLSDAAICHDCAVPRGAYHLPGCDAEQCPRCGGQSIGCDCGDDVRCYECGAMSEALTVCEMCGEKYCPNCLHHEHG